MTSKQKKWVFSTGALVAGGGVVAAALIKKKLTPVQAVYRGAREAVGAINSAGPVLGQIRKSGQGVVKGAMRGAEVAYSSNPIVKSANQAIWRNTGLRIIPKESPKAFDDAVKATAYQIAKHRLNPKSFSIPSVAQPPKINVTKARISEGIKRVERRKRITRGGFGPYKTGTIPPVSIRHHGGVFGASPSGVNYQVNPGVTDRGGRALTAETFSRAQEKTLQNARASAKASHVVRNQQKAQAQLLKQYSVPLSPPTKKPPFGRRKK